MDPFLGLNDPPSHEPFDLGDVDPFDSNWQDDIEQLGGTLPLGDGIQSEHEILEETDNALQPAGLVRLEEYDGSAEPPPGCIKYTIEWKAVLKTTRLGLDTEQDVFLAPGAFWAVKLRKRVDQTLDDQFTLSDRPQPCTTVIEVSVSKRAERDLKKSFVGFDIDWSAIEDRLESWGHYFHTGERLTVKMTFRFKSQNRPVQSRIGLRGRPSATRRMRHEQTLQRNAEEHATGSAAPWRTVYSLMRCPGRPCGKRNDQGHCWRDPHTGIHYKLLTVHLRHLVAYLSEGNKLESHSDVPEILRQQLYAEAGHRAEVAAGTRSSQPAMSATQSSGPTPAETPGATQHSPGRPAYSPAAAAPVLLERIDIPGPYEDAINDYVKWHQDQSSTEGWISQFAKAGDILIRHGYKLQRFYQKRLFDVLIANGVVDGIADSFHDDIPVWLPDYRQRFEEREAFGRETPGLPE